MQTSKESLFNALSSLNRFFFSGLGLSFLRIRLKDVQSKYRKVYLKSTHLEL